MAQVTSVLVELVAKVTTASWRSSVHSPRILPSLEVQFARSKGRPLCVGSGDFAACYVGYRESRPVVIKVFRRTVGNVSQVRDLTDIVTEAFKLTVLNASKATPHCHGLIILSFTPRYMSVGIVQDFIGEPYSFSTLTLEGLVSAASADSNVQANWCNIAERLTAKLEAVHDRSIILNDLKPDNVMLQYVDGHWDPILIDLGYATFRGQPSPFNFQPENLSDIAKNHMQLAPEAVTGIFVCEKSDVYSLGLIFRLLSRFDSVFCSIAKLCRRLEYGERPSTPEIRKFF